MKTFTILMMGMLLSFAGFAQVVPNGDFEDWETGLFGYETPVDWLSISSLIGSQDVFKVSPGYTGDYAAQLIPATFMGNPDPVAATLTTLFPVNERHGSLSGYIKGVSAGSDTLSILVGMTKDGDPIGWGFKITTQEITDYISFTAQIIYDGGEVPDSAVILITLGRSDGTAHDGSTYTIDGLSMSGSSGIDDQSTVFGLVMPAYPNPAENSVTIPFELKHPDQVSLAVFDVQGKLVHSESSRQYATGLNEIVLDITSMKKGLYFYNLTPTDGKHMCKTFIVK